MNSRILFIADSNEGRFQQHYDGCDHFFARKTVAIDIAPDPLADLGQRGRKLEHSVEFRLVANLTVLRVVTILAAPASVYAGRLQMTVREGTDPYMIPGGRNDKRPDTPQ